MSVLAALGAGAVGHSLPPLVVAFAATALAALRVVGLAATGMLFVRRPRPAFVQLPLAILAGAGVLGFAYALLLRGGMLQAALITDGIVLVFSLAVRGRDAVAVISAILHDIRLALGRSVVAWLSALVIALVYWLQAAVPPRDTDSLRYHLAHIRQIDFEGMWSAIPIAHYALPFGWQMTYLPFEHLGLPEAAQLLNASIALVMAGALVAWTRRAGATALLFLGALALQPLVLTSATNASADAFTILTALASVLLLAALGEHSPSARDSGPDVHDLRALGFVSWIGMNSRYQAAAIGVAALAVLLTWTLRTRLTRPPSSQLFALAQGAGLALLLASPWYAMNWMQFGNPVWPLHPPAHPATFANAVARAFADSWSGPLTPDFLLRSLWALVTDPLAFPLPLLVFGAIAVACASARRKSSTLWWTAVFAIAYVATWMIAQPMLFPRFILYVVPVAAIVWLSIAARADTPTSADAAATGAASSGRRRTAHIRRAIARTALGGTLTVFLLYDAASAAGPAAYLATGAARGLHRFTWYYPVYEWIDANAEPDSRFLVIVASAETYYLDRYYRRADPATSAVVDWNAMQSAQVFAARLARDGYDYVVYEPAAWGDSPGGKNMMAVIEQARSSGFLVPVTTFELDQSRSRFRRRPTPTTVEVLRVAPERETGVSTPAARDGR